MVVLLVPFNKICTSKQIKKLIQECPTICDCLSSVIGEKFPTPLANPPN